MLAVAVKVYRVMVEFQIGRCANVGRVFYKLTLNRRRIERVGFID